MMFLFGILITLIVFYTSKKVHRLYPAFFTHPVFLSTILIILFLYIGKIDYKTYEKGGKMLTFFLNPAACSLSYLLYKKWEIIKKYYIEVLLTITLSSILGIVSSYILMLWAGGTQNMVLSIVPKSVTTPIAVRISEIINGIPSLTAIFVVITGIMGAIIGPSLLDLFKIKEPLSWGLTMGITSHGIGTARAVEKGKLEGAISGVGFILMGLFTAIFAPYIIGILKVFMRK